MHYEYEIYKAKNHELFKALQNFTYNKNKLSGILKNQKISRIEKDWDLEKQRQIREELRDPIDQIQRNTFVLLIIFIVMKKGIILRIVPIRMELMC